VSNYNDPFGKADCESELEELGDDYKSIFFGQTPFNAAALDRQTYLIIGRRGAGKTALSQYFSFQKEFKNPNVIDVDEPKEYKKVLSEIARRTSRDQTSAVSNARDIWKYLIWCLIFQNTKDAGDEVAKACIPCSASQKYSHAGFLNWAIDWLFGQFDAGPLEGDICRLNDFIESDVFDRAQKAVIDQAKTRQIFVAIDTLEKYDPADTDLMNAIAGLVEAASEFNLKYSKHGIHIKAFISGEIFPYLEEVALQNPLKGVKHPVYMLWRAKDLLRLIAWRYHRFLKKENLLLPESKDSIDWDNPKDVLMKAWAPYFGVQIRNRRGVLEHSFPYVLRHTQMRPRQLIELCNSISSEAIKSGNFPVMSPEDIVRGVSDGESRLASEIVNSYGWIYPGVEKIIQALSNMPMMFNGNEIDGRAHESASHWKNGTYSQDAFRRLVVELGVVGKVVKGSSNSGFITAEFEYAQQSSMHINHRDVCVLHPMFVRKLNPELPEVPFTIMPFVVKNEESWWINGNE
jgi:hypothetical protein